MRVPSTRREFLKATAASAGALAVGVPAAARAKNGKRSESDEPKASLKWRFGGPTKEIIVLDKPHIVTPASPFLNSSGEIANKRFVLDPKRISPTGYPTGTVTRPFGVTTPLTAYGLLTLPPGSKNIRIVDCEFEGPWKSIAEIPHREPGHPRLLRGIDIFPSSDIRIEGCAFDNIPTEAIYFYGCARIEIEDVWSRNCSQLVRADWLGTSRNRYIRLNRLNHADGWGAADLERYPTYASVYEPGRAIGVNAVAGWFADSEISNLTTSGEVKSAIKLVNPVRVALDRVYSSNLMIQGTFYWNHSGNPREGNGKLGAYNHAGFDEKLGDHAQDVSITRSRFRPDQNAWRQGRESNTVQLSYHQDGIKFRDCVFYKPAESTGERQGIQVWDGVQLDVRDCLFLGWKKPADPLPPFPKQTIIRLGTYRKPGSLPVSINDDFVRVNRFSR